MHEKNVCSDSRSISFFHIFCILTLQCSRVKSSLILRKYTTRLHPEHIVSAVQEVFVQRLILKNNLYLSTISYFNLFNIIVNNIDLEILHKAV